LPEPPAPAAASPEQTAATAPTEPADIPLPPLGPPLDITPPAGVEADHLHGSDRAFADISHAKRPDRPGHAANARKKGPIAAEGGKPERPRAFANSFSWQDNFYSNPHP
jgi:hypothetical protein